MTDSREFGTDYRPMPELDMKATCPDCGVLRYWNGVAHETGGVECLQAQLASAQSEIAQLHKDCEKWATDYTRLSQELLAAKAAL